MPITVGLVQLNAELSWNRQRFDRRRKRGTFGAGPSSDEMAGATWSIFPYSVGLLQAYATRHAPAPDRYQFDAPVFRRASSEAIAARLAGKDVAGFSAYVWNERLSLSAARALKARSPSTLIVFGGPQVPDRSEAWLRAHPFVDVACHGEGEAVFLALLESLDRKAWKAWDDVPSLSWIDADGTYRQTARRARIRDLDTIPSPYLTGAFTEILAERPEEKWVMLWETNRGCPFSCSFCDWGSATASKVHRFSLDRLRDEVEWFGGNGGELIFCCDANFGMLPRDLDIARMAAATKERFGGPRTLSVQNTKNATDRAYQVQKTLADAGMNGGVTLAMQSLDAATLKAVRRDNISSQSFRELQARFRRDGIATYTDMILGLPGETYESYTNGFGAIMADGQHDRVQFYNCAILPNAELAEPAYRAEHGLVTVSQRLIGPHVPCEREGTEEEYYDVVIATKSMPANDWRRAKVFTWYSDLLHFDRLVQIPMTIAHATSGIGYRTFIEAMMDAPAPRFPVLAALRRQLDERATDIQRGGAEYPEAPDWLGITWPTDQWALIGLAMRWELDAFWSEAEVVLGETLAAHGARPDSALVRDAFALTRVLFATPFEIDDVDLELETDPWSAYQAAQLGQPLAPPEPVRGTVVRTRPTWLSWDDWLEHVVFCHNQKASYLYPWRAHVLDAAQAG